MLLDEKLWTGNIFIGGEWKPGRGGAYDVVEPATGEVLGRIGRATPEDVGEAARHAAEAQRAWAATPHPARAAVLRRAAQLWGEYAEEISGWNVREVGAIPAMAGFALHVAEQECYEAASLPSRPYGELLPSEEPRLSMAQRVPAGVVTVIAPFNVPIILSIRSVAPALALGNAVLLKPDPRTAVTGGVTLARVFAEAGLPDGLLQVLPGGTDVGEALVTHPLVRVISFTGSTRAGRRVGALAGEHLKRAHLELGGNSAMIVLDDADIAPAVDAASFGSWFHQGQICMTTGRHLVHDRLYDEFVERLSAKAAALPIGDPNRQQVVLGPIIDAGQRDKIHGVVTRSASSGARIAAGGTYEELFYSATVLADVSEDTPAFTEEIFGPVAPVMRFRDAEEAVRLATAGEYGLSLGIVTRDVMKGLALAERIPTGIVHINDQTVSDEANSPFGGVAASGTGSRFGGAAANIEAFTETRWVTVRDKPPAYPF
ncbi:aldehyde dehydrogenase family protein [Actinoplanes sp. GCM10030250]|uniref:aldehyde dehydrogenase family protein n=1 Tax=Actinoplanes sp. GCM10030250 TaxID=3273376 RepID=UPI003621C8A4